MHPDTHIQTYYSEFHFPEFTSAVADMKNSVADRNNGQPRFIHIKSYLYNAKIKVSYMAKDKNPKIENRQCDSIDNLTQL